MPLTKCKECGKDVSDQAATCPHCGVTVNKKAKSKQEPKKSAGGGCMLIIVIIGAMAVFGSIFGGGDTSPSKPAKPKTAAEIRKDTIAEGFSAWSGEHRELSAYITKNLKDPDSYEHIETRYVDKDTYLLLYTKYRAKNSFGGYVVEEVVAEANLNGELRKIISQ